VKKSLLHIEFIFIDGQKTISKDNTTQQQLNQQQRNHGVMCINKLKV